jgi:hypothetical protein
MLSRVCLLASLLMLSDPICAQKQPSKPNNHTAHPKSDKDVSQDLPVVAETNGPHDVSHGSPVIVQIVRGPKTKEETADDQKRTDEELANKYVSWVLTGFIAFAALVQAGVSIWQGVIYRRQYKVMADALIASNKSAESAVKGITALEQIERPFLIIEARGDQNTEFWAVNYGKAPAKIVYMESVPRITFPKWDINLPNDPEYGYVPGLQILNVQWIAPSKDMYLNGFSPSLFNEFKQELRNEINNGDRILYIHSIVKYSGILSEQVFESRYCYGFAQGRGAYMTGPYGYNSNT